MQSNQVRIVPTESYVPIGNKLLETGDYFVCEKYNCILKKEVCLLRQKSQKRKWGNAGRAFDQLDYCLTCKQGKEIQKELKHKKEDRVKERKVTKKPLQEVVKEVMKNESKKEVETTTKESKENCMCEYCRKHFESYKNGSQTIRRVCKACLHDKNRKKKITMNYKVLINFEEHKDLLNYLTLRAKKHFRPNDLEILTIINEAREKMQKEDK